MIGWWKRFTRLRPSEAERKRAYWAGVDARKAAPTAEELDVPEEYQYGVLLQEFTAGVGARREEERVLWLRSLPERARLRKEITRLKRNKKRWTHLQAELDALL